MTQSPVGSRPGDSSVQRIEQLEERNRELEERNLELESRIRGIEDAMRRQDEANRSLIARLGATYVSERELIHSRLEDAERALGIRFTNKDGNDEMDVDEEIAADQPLPTFSGPLSPLPPIAEEVTYQESGPSEHSQSIGDGPVQDESGKKDLLEPGEIREEERATSNGSQGEEQPTVQRDGPSAQVFSNVSRCSYF